MPCAPTTMGSPARDLDQGHGRGGPGLGVDQDAAVHLRPLHRDPAAVEADEGLQVGGGVEVLREDAVAGAGSSAGVVLLDELHAVLLQIAQDLVQLLLGGRGDPKEGQRLVVLLRAHLEAQDAVLPAALEDVVEHPGQQQRVDDVPFELDVFVSVHALRL